MTKDITKLSTINFPHGYEIRPLCFTMESGYTILNLHPTVRIRTTQRYSPIRNIHRAKADRREKYGSQPTRRLMNPSNLPNIIPSNTAIIHRQSVERPSGHALVRSHLTEEAGIDRSQCRTFQPKSPPRFRPDELPPSRQRRSPRIPGATPKSRPIRCGRE